MRMNPFRFVFWAWLILLAFLPAKGCHREEPGRMELFAGVEFYTQAQLDIPLVATEAQKRYDAAHFQQWQPILDQFARLLDRIETAGQDCPGRQQDAASGELPPREAAILRSQMDAEGERLLNDMARIDPTGAQSALLPHARRFVRRLRTVLPSAVEISCARPEILRGRIQSARSELKRLRNSLPPADDFRH